MRSFRIGPVASTGQLRDESVIARKRPQRRLFDDFERLSVNGWERVDIDRARTKLRRALAVSMEGACRSARRSTDQS